jgi:hypothetical protein
MTPEERSLLSNFLQDLSQARGGLKDAEASDLIDRTIRTNPDAAYVLVQHAIIADHALHAAQARVNELEGQLRAQAPGQGGPTSFLGGAPQGQPQGQPWGAGQPQPGYGQQQQPYGQQPGYGQPQPGYGQQPGQQPGYPPGYDAPPQPQRGGLLGGLFGGGGQPTQPSGFGSFLRTAGTTAAGVAGGEMLFSGLSGMFGGHRGGGMFGGGEPVENVTINEYGGGDRDRDFDDGGYDDGGYDDGGSF